MIGVDAKIFMDQMRFSNGSNVNIFRNFGSQAEQVFSGRMIKNAEKNGDTRPYFSFSEKADIQVGDVIKIEGARDFWRVTDIEDHIVAGTLVQVKVFFKKNDLTEQHSKDQQGASTVNILNIQSMHNSQIQQGSHGSSQTQVSQVSEFAELKTLIQSIVDAVNVSSLSEDRKELARTHAEILSQQLVLPEQHRNSKMVSSAWNGLAKLSDVVTVAPYVVAGAKLIKAIFGI